MACDVTQNQREYSREFVKLTNGSVRDLHVTQTVVPMEFEAKDRGTNRPVSDTVLLSTRLRAATSPAEHAGLHPTAALLQDALSPPDQPEPTAPTSGTPQRGGLAMKREVAPLRSPNADAALSIEGPRDEEEDAAVVDAKGSPVSFAGAA